MTSGQYYREKLSAKRLRQIYDLAPPRIRRYLKAEADHVRDALGPGDKLLDLGCGFGRVTAGWASKAGRVFNIDTAFESLKLGRRLLPDLDNVRWIAMNAACLALRDGCMDLTACIQNGISAFHVDPARLIAEAVRVTRPGGQVFFSSYSDRIWPDRLNWFRQQAAAGFLGEIDEDRTGDGVIVCRDGFTATTFGPERFQDLARQLGLAARILEIDASSVFCHILVS